MGDEEREREKEMDREREKEKEIGPSLTFGQMSRLVAYLLEMSKKYVNLYLWERGGSGRKGNEERR